MWYATQHCTHKRQNKTQQSKTQQNKTFVGPFSIATAQTQLIECNFLPNRTTTTKEKKMSVWRPQLSMGVGVAAAAAAAATAAALYLWNTRKEGGDEQDAGSGVLESNHRSEASSVSAVVEQPQKLHLPTPINSTVGGVSVALDIAESFIDQTVENSVFNADVPLDTDSVFESVPDGMENDTEQQQPHNKVDLAQALNRIVAVMHETSECNPAVVHPACIGYEYQGSYEDFLVDVPTFNPATISPVLLGVW